MYQYGKNQYVFTNCLEITTLVGTCLGVFFNVFKRQKPKSNLFQDIMQCFDSCNWGTQGVLKIPGFRSLINVIRAFINFSRSLCISPFEFLSYVGLLLSYYKWNSSMCPGRIPTGIVTPYICSLASEEN